MINLIPRPEKITQSPGIYSFSKKNATVFFSTELEGIEELLCEVMNSSFKRVKENADVSFIYDNDEKKEGYSLKIDNSGVRIFASSYEGAFYGLQTLRQLVESDFKNKKMLSSKYITIDKDSPRYSWRGVHLDESRHFFGKATVKKLDKAVAQGLLHKNAAARKKSQFTRKLNALNA